MRRRLLSLAMALAMALSLLPTAAWAEEEQPLTDVVELQPQEVVEPVDDQPVVETEEVIQTDEATQGQTVPTNVVPLAADGPDTSWYSDEGTAFTLSDAADLQGFAQLVNGGKTFKGKTVTLSAFIDLSGINWTPIGSASNPFQGTFDGGSFTISNLTVFNQDLDDAGLFGYLSTPGEIKNVTLENVNITARARVGALVGAAYTGTVTDCTVTGNIQISGNYFVGGLTGYGYAAIADCSVHGNTRSAVTATYKGSDLEGDSVGGLVGFRGEDPVVTEGCSVSGITVSGTRKVGGLVGSAYCSNIYTDCSVEDVTVISNAKIDYANSKASSMGVGGLVGILVATDKGVGYQSGTISDCSVSNVTLNCTESGVAEIAKMGLVSGGLYADRFTAPTQEQFEVSGITVSGSNSIPANAKKPEDGSQNSLAILGADGAGGIAQAGVAEVDGARYSTLQEAIDKAESGDTVCLLQDVTYSITVDITKDIILDLGGFTLTSSDASTTIKVIKDQSLTLRNGTVKNTNANGRSIGCQTGSTITVESDATVVATLDGIYGAFANSSTPNYNSGNVTMNISGTVQAGRVAIFGAGPNNRVTLDGAKISASGSNWAIYQNGSHGGCVYIIKNSTVTQDAPGVAAIFISASKDVSKQTLTIENSKISGRTGVEVKYTDVTITGENTEIVAMDDKPHWQESSNGSNTWGYALAVTHNGVTNTSSDGGGGTVSVEGGTFTGPIILQSKVGDVTETATIAISGGTFSKEIPEEYCAPGMNPTKNSDGTWSVTYDKSIFTSGTGTATDPCIIPDVAHLKAFRDSVNEGNNYVGVYIALMPSTIYDLSGEEWTPIGITGSDGADHSFKGHFNGQGATITGLKMTSDTLPYYNSFNSNYACYGFFGGVNGGTVENLIFTNVNINEPGTAPANPQMNGACNNTVAVAVGAAVNGAQIRNITVQSGSVTGHGRAAGVVGFVGADSNASTGGSVGNIVVEGCVNHAAVTSNWTYSSHGTAGGICATYNTYSADSGSATFQNNTNYGSITGFYAGGILASTFAGDGDLILTGNRNYGAISAKGRNSYYTEKADGTTTLWTPSAAGIAVGVAKATLTDNYNDASVNGSDGYAGGITSTIDETSTFAGTNTNTGNITGWRAGGIAASADGGVTLGTGLSSGGTIAPVDLNADVMEHYRDPAAIGGIVGVLGTKSVLDGAQVSSTASLNNTTNTPYAGTLVGCVQEGSENNADKPKPTIVKNVSDDAAIGAVRITSNDPHHVQFDNVHLSTLDAVATHNQEHTFTLTLEGSTIGTLAVDGAVHTGMTLEISKGTVEEVVFTHVTGNNKGTTAVKFAASDGAQIGTVDATDDSNNITYSGGLYVAAVGASTIGEVRTAGPVTVGFEHADGGVNSDGRDFPNTGTISAVVTSSTAYTVATSVSGTTGAKDVLYLSNSLVGNATSILNGKNPAGYENFTGVSLAENATATGTLTVAAGRTLVIEEGVTLDMNQNQLSSSGSIQNYGAITNLASESTPTVTTVVSFQVTPVNAEVVVKDGSGAAVSPASVNEYHLENGTYTYTVSLGGYVAQSGSFTVDGSAGRTISISLQPVPTPVPDDDDDTPSYSGGSSTPSYSNTIEVGDGGDVKVSPRTPEAGDTVTITPDPDAGYEVDEVIVTDRNGDAVRVTANRNGTYTFEQPRGRVTIEVTFVRTDSGLPFIDVAANAWYYDAVAYAYENGLMSGTASNLFSPNATTTRGMIVTMLYRLEGEPRVTTGSAFDDVDASMYYADAIAWANANGIVTGYDDTTFGPNDAITREQMAAILYRYAQYKGYRTTASADLSGYVDAGDVSAYALPALQWANAEGLVTGTSSNTLTPDGSAVRAQVATIFMRFMEGVAE